MTQEIERGNDEIAFFIRSGNIEAGRSYYEIQLIYDISEERCPTCKFQSRGFIHLFEHYRDIHYNTEVLKCKFTGIKSRVTKLEHTKQENREYGILQQIAVYESSTLHDVKRKGNALLKLSKEFGFSPREIGYMIGLRNNQYDNGQIVLKKIEKALPPTKDLPQWFRNAMEKP